MSTELQARAKAFLARPIPDGMSYVPDSFAERFIATYASDGKLDLDAELAEMLELCVMESFNAGAEKPAVEAAFFQESAEILQAILAEGGQ